MTGGGGRLNGQLNARALRMTLRVRAEAVQDAQRALAAAIAVSDRLARVEADAVAAIHRETAHATDVASGDVAVEAFAAWLPTGQGAVAAARASRQDAEGGIVRDRAVLRAARTAEAATQALLDQHAARLAEKRASQEQARSDEAAAIRPGRARGGG